MSLHADFSLLHDVGDPIHIYVKTAIHNIISALLAISAIMLLLVALLVNPLIAQTFSDRLQKNEDAVGELDHRLTVIDQLQIDHRLTAIETALKYASYANYGSTGGTAVLLFHAYLTRKRKRGE